MYLVVIQFLTKKYLDNLENLKKKTPKKRNIKLINRNNKYILLSFINKYTDIRAKINENDNPKLLLELFLTLKISYNF